MIESAPSEPAEREVTPLPPTDRGRQAWSFVTAGFAIETLLWGGLFSTGVFLKYYAANEPFSRSSETKISLIGTTSLFIGYGAGIPLIYLYNRHPRIIKSTVWTGLAVYVACMLGASWAQSVDALIVLQGVGPGLAGALCAFPVIRWLPEWFDKRKGLAAGVIFSGGGVGGAYMPILNQYLLDRIGLAWTLRTSALTTAVLGGTAICFLNPRVPIPATRNVTPAPMPNLRGTFWHPGFFGCLLATLLQGFGFFNVGLFIPRFSDSLSSTAGAGLLSAFNVSCIIAQILWGFLTDRMRPAMAMALSSALGSCLVLTLWGFGGSHGIALLVPFAVLFGIASGGFSSMWSQSACSIVGHDKEQQTMLVSGFSFARGLGAVIGPTIGSALYRESNSTPEHHLRWGSAGSPGLVSLVAASMASSAAVGLLFASCESSSITKLANILRSFLSPTNANQPRRQEERSLALSDPASAIELTRIPSRAIPNLESEIDHKVKG
ncbi:hypothetical protein FFLO_06903 [Filobasidium floriforme]|uniref:MFS general substrate transporter n=1 Tax=Filobasidium floriforme TaxID=5210 RepID=A0A8K0NLN9_9TREE|nr:major facilitator superfamily domain-containing protein [Filobasidium floriforme]KAG7527466.1 hypothetical protein FFLO_06903 [Filobasidium floriforme]KAH8085932.1 major facilitator superfamily domain-containing protein [Filobasidium floriforme]